jgi:NaMN:DMB phosphoribosyltransferase
VPDLVELVRAPIAEAAGNVAAAQNIMLTPGTALAALTACKGNPVKLLELKVAALDPRKLTIFATKLGEKDHELAIQAAQMQPIADLAAKLDECARSLAALSEKQDATATAAASNTDRIMGAINTTAASRK